MFIDLAIALTGYRTGGPAKASVVALLYPPMVPLFGFVPGYLVSALGIAGIGLFISRKYRFRRAIKA